MAGFAEETSTTRSGDSCSSTPTLPGLYGDESFTGPQDNLLLGRFLCSPVPKGRSLASYEMSVRCGDERQDENVDVSASHPNRVSSACDQIPMSMFFPLCLPSLVHLIASNTTRWLDDRLLAMRQSPPTALCACSLVHKARALKVVRHGQNGTLTLPLVEVALEPTHQRNRLLRISFSICRLVLPFSCESESVLAVCVRAMSLPPTCARSRERSRVV